MNKFHLTVNQYRERKRDRELAEFGFVNEDRLQEDVQAYATAKRAYMRELQARQSGEDFNPFTDDPNCKSCGKGKGKKAKAEKRRKTPGKGKK